MDHKFPFDHFLNFKNHTLQPHLFDNQANLPSMEENQPPKATPIPRKKKTSSENSLPLPPIGPQRTGIPADVPSLGQHILSLLKDLITPQKFNAYFQDTFHLEKITGETITFNVTTNFIKTMVENQYLPHIQESVKSVLGKNYQISIRVDSEENPSPSQETLSFVENSEETPSVLSPTGNALLEELSSKKSKKWPSMKEARFQLDLIPSPDDLLKQVDSTVLTHMEDPKGGPLIDHKKTFENFIVGPSNNMAYASILAATKGPGKVYPCIYLNSNSGLGKTHLLNAMANKLREIHPHLKVCYTTTRDFMMEMIAAMQNKRSYEFRRKYSEQVDVLMIEDIQELSNKDGTQNEFFYVFNELYNKGKQLIFTSDKPPKSINGLEERIKTRLSWGLVMDIQEPDMETRMAILKKKVADEDIFIPGDVLSLIATSVKGNIRELEGSLIRLGAYASVMKVDIDLEIAKEQLKITHSGDLPQLSMESVAKAVSQYLKIPVADICSKVRSRNVTFARHVAMYLSHKLLQETLTKIGFFFGNRDHSSVLHAVEKIKIQMKEDREFLHMLSEIESSL